MNRKRCKTSRRGPSGRARRGMTIIEMMVTVTITLILMGAIMTIFGMIAGAVRQNQARMEVVDRMKSVTARLQADLQGRTALTLPWNRIESASGYFMYVEGPGTDATPDSGSGGWLQIPTDPATSTLKTNKILGDMDDVLAMTVRSRGAPFIGRGPDPTKPIESYLAEIVWFVRPAETSSELKPLTLYRRVLLIVSEEQAQNASASSAREFFEKYDISAHLDRQSGRMVPNTLSDLTMPENRFSHKAGAVGSIDLGADAPMKPFPKTSERYGEDVMLTNIVGFDIKAFDPWASFGGSEDDVAMVPGDFQYSGGGSERGVYVDIGGPGGGDYGGQPRQESRLSGGGQFRGLFDTWSFHYEHDGVSQGAAKDGATDLLDGNGTGGVDDGSEREVCAPYLRPLRGIQVSLRCYEPRSRQVEQVTLASDFMPR